MRYTPQLFKVIVRHPTHVREKRALQAGLGASRAVLL